METLDRKNKKLYILITAVIVFIILINIKLSGSITNVNGVILDNNGRMALAVLVFALILWITEALPFHITGLISMILLTLTKVGDFKEVVKLGFGNDIIVFFIGVLILSAFINKSGLGKRISLFILSMTGNDTRKVILGFMAVGVFLSMWVTDMAVAAMLMPLAKAIVEEEKLQPLKSNFGKALLISTAWGPIIGGIGTPAGCGPNPIAVGFLKSMAGIDFSFLDWMIFGVPSAIILIFPAWLILISVFPPEIKKLSKSKNEMSDEFRALPKINKEEKVTMTIFLSTAVLWIASPVLEKWLDITIPISMPVLLTSCLFFIPGMTKTKWKEIEREISWNGIILITSGIALGMMLYDSGAAKWLSMALLGGIENVSVFVRIFAVIIIVSFLKIAFSSNTVTATVIIPIMIVFAMSMGMNPISIALPAAITASLAFIMVTSTPTNVIPYSAGYFSISDLVKAGVLLTVVSSAILAGTIYFIGTIVNIY